MPYFCRGHSLSPVPSLFFSQGKSVDMSFLFLLIIMIIIIVVSIIIKSIQCE